MRQFLSRLFGQDAALGDAAASFGAEQLATAVLMVETARLDGAVQPLERDRIQHLLAKRFGLTPWVAAELLGRAERTATESVAWQGLTHTLKEALDADGRVEILELLWEVAYADGALHDYEASLLRRVGGLLYVSDRDNGDARLRVMQRLGIPR